MNETSIKQKIEECKFFFENGEIEKADVIIRKLARGSSHGIFHDIICELEEKIVDQIILKKDILEEA